MLLKIEWVGCVVLLMNILIPAHANNGVYKSYASDSSSWHGMDLGRRALNNDHQARSYSGGVESVRIRRTVGGENEPIGFNEGEPAEIPFQGSDEYKRKYLSEEQEFYCWDGIPCNNAIVYRDNQLYWRVEGVPPEFTGNIYAIGDDSVPPQIQVRGTNIINYSRPYGLGVRSEHTLTENTVDSLRQSPGIVQPLGLKLGDRNYESALLLDRETGIDPLITALSNENSLLVVIDGRNGTLIWDQPITSGRKEFSLVGWSDDLDQTRSHSNIAPPRRACVEVRREVGTKALNLTNCKYCDIENIYFTMGANDTALIESSGSAASETMEPMETLETLITAENAKCYIRQCRFRLPCDVRIAASDGQSINFQEPFLDGCPGQPLIEGACQINHARARCGDNQTDYCQPGVANCSAALGSYRGNLICANDSLAQQLTTNFRTAGQKCFSTACLFGAVVPCSMSGTLMPMTVATATDKILPIAPYAIGISLGICSSIALAGVIDVIRYCRKQPYTVTGGIARLMRPPGVTSTRVETCKNSLSVNNPLYIDPDAVLVEKGHKASIPSEEKEPKKALDEELETWL